MRIILIHPQIPQNSGNIVRTCAVTGSRLTLVRPLGFSVTDRWLKRSGLDYWEGVEVDIVEEEEIKVQIQEAVEQGKGVYFFSSKATRTHYEVQYKQGDWLVFGSETSGLPEYYHKNYSATFVRIPMRDDARCLNLATSVGVGVYEAVRQSGLN